MSDEYMPRMMKAAVFKDIRKVELEEIPVPEINDDEILVKIDAALTCGTDVKTFKRGPKKKTPYSQAIHVFGHEYAGTIEAVGKNVKNFKPGERITSANSAPCNKCFYCKNSQFSLCENLTWLWGTFAEYIKVPSAIVEKNTLKIPDNVDSEIVALTEPLACVLHGIERTGIKIGDVIVINGAGPIGLMYVVLAKMKGAHVISTDLSENRLEFAKKLGADEIIQVKDGVDIIDEVRKRTEDNRGVDVAIEAVGIPQVWENTIKMVRKGGIVNLFGGCPSGTSISIDTSLIHYGEVQVKGVFHHTPLYIKKAFNLLVSGEFPGKEFITEKMPLEKVNEALEKIINQEGIKIALIP
ncbi:MAG: zinc-dependent alcohol dehydrogenase [Promethearchaeota archaeon]